VIKVDDDVYQKLSELSQKLNKPLKDLATQAIRMFLQGTPEDVVDAEIEDITRKWISLKFPTKCSGCGKHMQQGNEAYYVKYVYKDNKVPPKTLIYCVQCYFEKVESDELIARRYVKLRELERIVKYLEKRSRELADVEMLNNLLKDFVHAREVVLRMISEKSFKNEDVRALEEVCNRIDSLLGALSTVKMKLQEKKRVEPWARRRY